eukprot:6579330-Prymnesium_polylepis.1
MSTELSSQRPPRQLRVRCDRCARARGSAWRPIPSCIERAGAAVLPSLFWARLTAAVCASACMTLWARRLQPEAFGRAEWDAAPRGR